MFITPGALLVVLRFFSSTPPTPESTLARSDVSADMFVDVVVDWRGRDKETGWWERHQYSDLY